MILSVLGDHDEKTLEQLRDVDSRAEYTALMADGHLGYIMPIGGVAAFDNKVSVTGVGFDIACGNCAVKTDMTVEHFHDNFDRDEVADEFFDHFAFGWHSNKAETAPRDDMLFNDWKWSIIPIEVRRELREKARAQIGSIGSGNHYLDVFAGEDGHIWIGVHFGSRKLGHTIASSFLALSQGKWWGERVPEQECLLDLDEDMGREYWHLMQLAGGYAYLGRNWVCDEAMRLLGCKELDRVHNNHNYAWREEHFDRELIVVRKGATPAYPGQRGFVGGSMGDESVILHGKADFDPHMWLDPNKDAGAQNLWSTVHGAGRVMGRMEARGKKNKDGTWKREPKVDRGEFEEWLDSMGVVRRGGGLDEAPQAYRRLTEVLEEHSDSIEVEMTLKPLIVCMAP